MRMHGLEASAITWIICAVASYFIARSRGAASPETWALGGLVLGPIGVLLATVRAKPPKPGMGQNMAADARSPGPVFWVIVIFLLVLLVWLMAQIPG
jgi:hypothetical protein